MCNCKTRSLFYGRLGFVPTSCPAYLVGIQPELPKISVRAPLFKIAHLSFWEPWLQTKVILIYFTQYRLSSATILPKPTYIMISK